jgi:hypothetical protein
MLKIVDVHLSSSPQGEYVVLQNQGLQTISLRGWAVVTDRWFWGEPESAALETYVFCREVAIRPYTRVVLFTGEGEEGWCPTTDGKQAYLVYWGRDTSAWHDTEFVNLVHVASSKRVIGQPVLAEEVASEQHA